jgi:hypothetical protein
MASSSTYREIKVVTVREEPFPAGIRSGLFDSPERILGFWRTVITQSTWFHDEKEHLVCICLDARLRLKSFSLVSLGSLNGSIAHPREIFRPAIVDSAYGVVVLHNHPSGDPTPSQADNWLTWRLYGAAHLLQIPLVDHIIVGNKNYFSFREARGLWLGLERDAKKLEKIISRRFMQPARRRARVMIKCLR